MLFAIILTMRLFPEIPISRAMHRAFVEAPVSLSARLTRTHLIFAVAALAMSFCFVELIMVLGSSDLVLVMAWDVSLYVDAVIATWTVAVVTRVKMVWQRLKTGAAALVRHAQRPRAPRRRSSETKRAPDYSDEGGAGWTYALAA